MISIRRGDNRPWREVVFVNQTYSHYFSLDGESKKNICLPTCSRYKPAMIPPCSSEQKWEHWNRIDCGRQERFQRQARTDQIRKDVVYSEKWQNKVHSKVCCWQTLFSCNAIQKGNETAAHSCKKWQLFVNGGEKAPLTFIVSLFSFFLSLIGSDILQSQFDKPLMA